MTTNDKLQELIEELRRGVIAVGQDEIGQELYDIDGANELMAEAADALVTPKAEPIAWLSYWPGVGSVDSTTRTTHLRGVAERWRADGAEVTPLEAALLPTEDTKP